MGRHRDDSLAVVGKAFILSRFKPDAKMILAVAVLIAAVGVKLVLFSHAANELNYTTTWFGNTYGGLNGKWIPNSMQGMTVLPDGTVYTSSLWEEGGREIGGFKNGQVWGPFPHLHGSGGLAVAADNNYIYSADNSAIYRYPRATFDKMSTGDLTGQSMNIGGAASGLAVNNGELYVADPNGDYTGSDQRLAESTVIKVYDLAAFNGTIKRQWTVPRARNLVFDAAGDLWVLQQRDSGNPPRIIRYDRSGNLLPQQITSVGEPIALAVDPTNNTLLVGDNGPDQNIKIFTNLSSTPTLLKTFGTKGGYLAGPVPGRTGPLRFDGPKGVGVDANGNIYVASTGTAGIGDRIWSRYEYGRGLSLESYKPDGTLNWRVDGLEFIDRGSVDPGSENDYYTRDEHVTMDYSKPGGQWQYDAHTLDPFTYPNDPRITRDGARNDYGVAWTRRFAGGKYMFITGQHAGYMNVFRFNGQSEIAIPSGSVPLDSASTWGLYPDSDGNVWQATQNGGIKRFRVQASGGGAPVYSQSTMDNFPMPSPFVNLRRVEYHPETDTLYLSGYTASNYEKTSNNAFLTSGPTIARYDHWLAGNRTPTFVIDVSPYSTLPPPDINGDNKPLAMSAAGDYLFVQWLNDMPDSQQGLIRVYNAHTGAYVGLMQSHPEIGLRGLDVDSVNGIEAYQRSSGEYVVTTEEGSFAKNMVVQWCPSNNCSQTPAPAPSPPPTPAPEPPLTLSSTQATGDVNLNGILAESDWKITNDLQKNVVGQSDNQSKFGVTWDNDNLYVGIRVQDVNAYNDSANPWDDDAIELYIDGNDNHGGTYDSADRQFVIRAQNGGSVFEKNGHTTGVRYASQAVSGGYTMEIAIPWSNLNLNPHDGLKLGLDVGNDDDDNGGSRDSQLMWSGTAQNYTDTSQFGELSLVAASAKPSPPPPPAPPTGDMNSDGHVNIYDLAILLGSYNRRPGEQSYLPAADLNHDGVVNVYDLSLLLNKYGG